MSAINQAQLILTEKFHVPDRNMKRRNLYPWCEADLTLIRIHLPGWLLEVLVGWSDIAMTGCSDISSRGKFGEQLQQFPTTLNRR